MAKKIFTDESLATFVEEIKSYTNEKIDNLELITIDDIDSICNATT